MSVLRLLQRNIPVPASNELRLLHEARTTYAGLRYADLSAELLARITRERGVDFATALLYDRIRRSLEHGAFIRDVEALAPDLDALPRLSGTVLVAPATLYREFPEFGGDGLLVRQIAADFGLDAALLPVPSTGTVAENAEIIRRLLAAEQQ